MSSAANWPIFMARLSERHEVAENTMAFNFEKPAGWTYKAGQFVDITLLNPPETDAEGNKRGFSISSAPQEPTIMVTTRLRDTAFKRVLRKMPLDSEVRIEGPFGNLTLQKNSARPAVLLAGGIGITPFRSIIVSATKEKLARRIFLFYSNRRPEDSAFLQELQALETQNANFKLIATMTEVEKSARPWKGELGMIDYKMLDRHLKAVTSPEGPIYFIAGPPQMVRDLQTMLTNAGVDTDDIRTEEFSGY
jgi:ferredoxin-NADP reductase